MDCFYLPIRLPLKKNPTPANAMTDIIPTIAQVPHGVPDEPSGPVLETSQAFPASPGRDPAVVVELVTVAALTLTPEPLIDPFENPFKPDPLPLDELINPVPWEVEPPV